MPIYEYYCADCHGVFEQLRRLRDANDVAPCPECDGDSERVLSTDLQIFTMRDGYPRRLPDRGTHWHLGKEVQQPIRGTVVPGDHPELVYEKNGPPQLPSIEEREAFDEKLQRRREAQLHAIASGEPAITDGYVEQETLKFKKRVVDTEQRRRLARRRAPNNQMTPRTRSGKHGKDQPKS
ncbi:MAG: zinc ribbon domain-containing protein [Dehalococcoidia bacterium]